MPNIEHEGGPIKADKPPKQKRQRRNNTGAKIALALVESHLKGVYSQMDNLKKAIDELRTSLS